MMSELEQVIGVTFQDGRLLQSAFIHRSFKHEYPQRCAGLEANERLEFLGDAVLNFLTAALIYQHFPDHSEGELTHLRAALVKTTTLADFARSLDFGAQIKISRGEDTPTARNRPALLADVFEAVIGAIYLDQGLDAVQSFVLPFLEQRIAAIEAGEVEVDYRTRLQEQAQSQQGVTPVYRTIEVRGPDHMREFTLEVVIGDEVFGVGSGPSKQAAAQAAARAAFQKLTSD